MVKAHLKRGQAYIKLLQRENKKRGTKLSNGKRVEDRSILNRLRSEAGLSKITNWDAYLAKKQSRKKTYKLPDGTKRRVSKVAYRKLKRADDLTKGCPQLHERVKRMGSLKTIAVYNRHFSDKVAIPSRYKKK